MSIKDRLNDARTGLELRLIGRTIHRSTDPSLRPWLQQLIDVRKVELWSKHHRRARQDQEKTLTRLKR